MGYNERKYSVEISFLNNESQTKMIFLSRVQSLSKSDHFGLIFSIPALVFECLELLIIF